MTHWKTDKERKAERLERFNFMNSAEVLQVKQVLDQEDLSVRQPDMWGRYATNHEKAAALIKAGYRLVEEAKDSQ